MIWLIAKREILARIRTKAFQIFTAILFVGIVAGAILIKVLGGGDEAEEYAIGLVGDGVSYSEAIGTATDVVDPEIVTDGVGKSDLGGGRIDVLFDGGTLTWEGTPKADLDEHVRIAVQNDELLRRASELDLAPNELATLFTPKEIGEERLDGGDDENGLRIATAVISTVAMFMLLQVWGAFMMMGVIEEKSSRVVEILLSHVRPITLLTGKVIGIGLLALFQLVIVIAGIAVGLSLAEDISVPSDVWAALPLAIVIFIFGFLFYGTAFAAMGSTVSRQEDAQSAQLPLMLPLMAGYIIAFSAMESPDGIVARVGSLVPFTSPVVLPFRLARTTVPWWEIVLSLGLLAVSAFIMIQLAARIYRSSLLRMGSKISLRSAWNGEGS